VEAAKKEGTFTCYCWDFNNWQSEWVRKSFKAATGIEMELMSFSGTISTERIKTEARAGKYIADVFGAVTTYHPDMEKLGLLKRIDNLPALRDVGDPDLWQFSPIVSPYTLASPKAALGPVAGNFSYNANLLPPERMPKKPQDLLDPWLKGKMCEINPITMSGLDSTLWRHYRALGYPDYWPEFYWDLYNKGSRHFWYLLGSADPLIKGDCLLKLGWSGVAAGTTKEININQRAPWIKAAGLGIPPLGISTQGHSLTAKSPHPNAGMLFENWLFSKEGQQTWVNAGWGAVARRDVTSLVEKEYWPSNPVTQYWISDAEWMDFEGYSYSAKGVFKLTNDGMSKDAWLKWVKDLSMTYWGKYPPAPTTTYSFEG